MTHDQIVKEIASLPPEGQKQVERFINSLRQTYSSQHNLQRPVTSDWHAAGFLGMWQDRDDMQDSSAWVRTLRQSEWIN